jgi:hypothetical protein
VAIIPLQLWRGYNRQGIISTFKYLDTGNYVNAYHLVIEVNTDMGGIYMP